MRIRLMTVLTMPTFLMTVLSGSLIASLAQAGPGELFFRRHAQTMKIRAALASQPVVAGITTGTFDQKIDHDAPSATKTFKQRYWINSTYAQGANAPVFMYI